MENKLYTIYKITNLLNGMIYIGQHVTKNLNDGYMGSGSNLKEAYKEFDIKNFTKEILFVFDTKEEMVNKEKEIVNKEFILRTDTYNIFLGGGGFSTNGLLTVKDKNGKRFTVSTKDSRYLSGELVSVNKNRIYAYDKNDRKFIVEKNDIRLNTGELVVKEKIKIKSKFNLEEIKEIILNCNIDFSKYGWRKNLSILINMVPSSITRWMKINMNEFYKEKCFKQKYVIKKKYFPIVKQHHH